MAHKVTNSEEAVKLMDSKAVNIDTLASAIVRGKGLNMSENKAEFFIEYTATVNKLTDMLGFMFGQLFEEEWAKSSDQ